MVSLLAAIKHKLDLHRRPRLASPRRMPRLVELGGDLGQRQASRSMLSHLLYQVGVGFDGVLVPN
jgi:hypothetical protein